MGSDFGNKTIGLKRDADLTKRDYWDEYLDWLTDMTIEFRKRFLPAVEDFLKHQKNCLAEYVGTITDERKNPPQSRCVRSVKSR